MNTNTVPPTPGAPAPTGTIPVDVARQVIDAGAALGDLVDNVWLIALGAEQTLHSRPVDATLEDVVKLWHDQNEFMRAMLRHGLRHTSAMRAAIDRVADIGIVPRD